MAAMSLTFDNRKSLVLCAGLTWLLTSARMMMVPLLTPGRTAVFKGVPAGLMGWLVSIAPGRGDRVQGDLPCTQNDFEDIISNTLPRVFQEMVWHPDHPV